MRKATVVSAGLARQLEARIKDLEGICLRYSERVDAIVKERDDARRERDTGRTRVDDLNREIIGLRADLSSWKADARTSDQNTALAEEKYKVALEIIRIISGKEGF